MEKRKKPNRREMGSKLRILFGMFFILLGLFVFIFSLIEFSSDSTSFGAFVGSVGCCVFGYVIMLHLGVNYCCYCRKEIRWGRAINVYWSELTEFSKKETSLEEHFHKKCHENAVKKFKIPDPKFADFPI